VNTNYNELTKLLIHYTLTTVTVNITQSQS